MEDEFETIWVEVAVRVKKGVDHQDVVSEMNYEMIHPDIISTEITNIR